MAIYAWLDCLWCKRDGFPNREPEVDHLLWHAADPPSDCGPSEDGGTVSVYQPVTRHPSLSVNLNAIVHPQGCFDTERCQTQLPVHLREQQNTSVTDDRR